MDIVRKVVKIYLIEVGVSREQMSTGRELIMTCRVASIPSSSQYETNLGPKHLEEISVTRHRYPSNSSRLIQPKSAAHPELSYSRTPDPKIEEDV